MEAGLATAHVSAADRPLPPVLRWRLLASLAAWTALSLFLALAPLLAIRRLCGAMTQPLPGPLLVPLGAGLAAAAVLLRLSLLPAGMSGLHAARPLTRQAVMRWSLVALPSVALAVLLVSVMTPGTSLPAALAALLFAGVIDGLFWRHIAVTLRAGPQRVEQVRQSRRPTVEDAQAADDDETYPADLLQQIVRTRGEACGETIHAVLRAEFQPGEQTHVLHVAFCPPLACPPKLEGFVVGETAADVKVTAAYTFGARLEVHRSSPAGEPIELIVELVGDANRAT
jgi:hypothetical protein